MIAILYMHFLPSRHVAVIYRDGEEVERVDLSRVTQSYTIPLEGNTILVQPGQICMRSANCPDQLCVRQGTIHSFGRIVCLPNRVVIEIQPDQNAPDAKVG